MTAVAIVLVWLSGFASMGALMCFTLGGMKLEGAAALVSAVGFLIPLFYEVFVL